MLTSVNSSQTAATAGSTAVSSSTKSASSNSLAGGGTAFSEVLESQSEAPSSGGDLFTALAALRQKLDAGYDWRQLSGSPAGTPAGSQAASQESSVKRAVSRSEVSGADRVTVSTESDSSSIEGTGDSADFSPTYLEPLGLGPDGSRQTLNPKQWASRETAEALAKSLGANGIVELTLDGPFHWSVPQYLLDFGSVQLNAGLVADLYSKYDKNMVDSMVQKEIAVSRGAVA
jgi:hypothetical protein